MRPPKYSTNLHSLKFQALELLEWTMDDLSPPGHRLEIKCGIEREGHAVPPELPNHPETSEADFLDDLESTMETTIRKLRTAFHRQFSHLENMLERFYYDKAGLFIVELVTRPLGLTEAATADIELSKALIQLFDKNRQEIAFGEIPTDMRARLQKIGWHDDSIDKLVEGQVYPRQYPDESAQEVLVGRGHHGNVSIWLDGKENLFADYFAKDSLMRACGAVGTHMLKDMVMPCRNGNYDRVASNESFSIQDIGMGDDKEDHTTICFVAGPERENRSATPDQKVRLEFRLAAAEADPLDVALSSGAPLVKTLLDHCEKDEQGKIRMENGKPVIINEPSAELIPMPKSHEEAKKIFNSSENSYFVLLNRLADRKIARLQERANRTHGENDRQLLRQAEAELKQLGSRMHALYCRAEGMQSAMPQPRQRPELAFSY